MSPSQNRVAIVTGAGHGIGAGISRRLASDGWRVVVSDIDPDRTHRVATEIGGIPHPADVSVEADLDRLVAAARAQFGRIDAVISNAGIMERTPLAQTRLERWNAVLATNLTAAFLLARAAEIDLTATNGSLVLIASTRAHMSEPETFAYSAAKGGLVALAHSLAVSMGPRVRVNCISPGWINVDDEAKLSAEDHAQHPVGRVGRADDVAGAVAYLLSPDAGFMTGAELVLDGGMTRKMIYV
jgi:NAD(P)-dependent dehydrogenase (short-subunit alcohol dehydrogenase family)